MLSDFRDWLEEEGITSPTLTVGSVDIYDKPWNKYQSDAGIRRSLGFKDPWRLGKDEYDDEDEEIAKDAVRLKTQFFKDI